MKIRVNSWKKELTSTTTTKTAPTQSGYSYLDWEGRYWLEDIPAYLSAHYNQWTQELRLAGASGDRLRWLAGLYAYQMTNHGDFIAGGFPLAQVSRNRLEGYAAFGEATFSIADGIRVTAGGRWSQDHREGDGTTAFGQSYSADEDYDQLDWKLAAEFDLGSNSMLYAAIQTGYQPGSTTCSVPIRCRRTRPS